MITALANLSVTDSAQHLAFSYLDLCKRSARLFIFGHECRSHEIGEPRIVPELKQQGRHLATMVRLMIEEMRYDVPKRRYQGVPGRPSIGEVAFEKFWGELFYPTLNCSVGLAALYRQLGECFAEDLRQRLDREDQRRLLERTESMRVP